MDLCAHAVPGLPEIGPGDDLASLILAVGAAPANNDVVVVAHKAISKAENRVVTLADVEAGPQAIELAATLDKDPRHVQVILDQSASVLRADRGVLICRTLHGFVCANAGVDASNAPRSGTVVLLPNDPDRSARELRRRLGERAGVRPAVLITDSFGRAWRNGQCDVAIGCAGLAPLDDWRGRVDAAGGDLRATWIALADEIAGAADLCRAKDSREPVVIVGGLQRYVTDADGPGAVALIRPLEEDLFG